MGHPRAGPRGVVQACDRTALRRWKAARTAAPVRHQGVAGRQAAVHGATRRRSRTAPCPLRCRDRHTGALSPATQQQNRELFPTRGKSLSLPLSPTHTTRLRGPKQSPRGEHHTKKANLLQRSRYPHSSAFHSRTRPRPLIGRIARPPIRTLSFTFLTRAQRTRVHFCPQHWLLCHLGLY